MKFLKSRLGGGPGNKEPFSPLKLPPCIKREHRLPACAKTGKMPVLPVIITFAKSSFLKSPLPQRGERVRVRGEEKTFGNEYEERWRRVGIGEVGLGFLNEP